MVLALESYSQLKAFSEGKASAKAIQSFTGMLFNTLEVQEVESLRLVKENITFVSNSCSTPM